MQNRIEGYLTKLVVYQFNVCPIPKAMGQRLLLNEEMWMTANEEQMRKIPNIDSKLRAIWNTDIVDGEYLEILDETVLDKMLEYDLFPMYQACFPDELSESQQKDVELGFAS